MLDRQDKAVQEKLLDTAVVGRTLFVKEEAASTNSLAKKLAREGCPEGTAILARSQSGGRGRRGAAWFSPRGGLWLSVILSPRLGKPELFWLTLAAAEAVRETMAKLCGLSAEIKRPNDVLIGPRKVCGILTETEGKGRGARAVVGIGLNVNIRREDFPPDLRETATSLLIETGRPQALMPLAAVLLQEIERLYLPLRRGEVIALQERFGDWTPASRFL
ncbi:MAG: biotin--[acetyl-CoA-carboxylase] ligase [Candidatus Aureabacteria bacterium]|nr:biotin--[acetyl-CoA-carboxylase] ligase [Candidatus Auribacterota bacterium]